MSAWRLPTLRRVAGAALALAGAAAVATPTLDFTPPAAGSYTLQRIQPAGDGRVLDATGQARRLSNFTRGRITLLSFIYTRCSDPDGCPYAFVVLHRVRSALEALPAARGRVGIVSLSFDPEHDTPALLAQYGGEHAGPERGVPWDFLTTASTRDLQPIVDAFGQHVLVRRDPPSGRPNGRFTHLLKVFLIDATGMVREIYASDTLLAEVLIADIETLLLEAGAQRP